jgi:hypothetical protein
MKGNTIHFEVTCKNSHSTGDVTYSGDSMKGTESARCVRRTPRT